MPVRSPRGDEWIFKDDLEDGNCVGGLLRGWRLVRVLDQETSTSKSSSLLLMLMSMPSFTIRTRSRQTTTTIWRTSCAQLNPLRWIGQPGRGTNHNSMSCGRAWTQDLALAQMRWFRRQENRHDGTGPEVKLKNHLDFPDKKRSTSASGHRILRLPMSLS